ncbi:hypothetical protein COU80_04210 [Candidatus Peregrinibacteria bacterium CG10_big_fil_rev_8_21_14_0_10_55_24]|nr:MAG: hypothetical protein COU80_04210 [Candidatus Peregrinibacteria bacterium CG10_big_fil_rev_8_21_14_0_10_55_24]
MKPLFPLASLAIILVACMPAATPPAEEEQESMSSSSPVAQQEETARETKNVLYRGVVKPAGISIYQQGSHRLLQSDGRFILLESDAVDLNGYVGEEVEVFGDLRPTVEAGGMIMRVRSISLLDAGSTDAEPDAVMAQEGTGDTLAMMEEETVESSSSAAADPEESAPSSTSSSSSVETEEPQEPEHLDEEEAETSSADTTDPAFAARVTLMQEQDLSPEQWTQQYCTAHIGFCIPVHRNWWYRSFGTTTSFLWHVELSSEEVQGLTQGPISVNLITGSVGAKKATDGQVRIVGGTVTGYREWTENRHFEISAPAALETSVRYILDHLVEYVEE